ncbi:MAG: hypothetical protein V1808_01135 [Candidatus Daviesbacteria bacterium]
MKYDAQLSALQTLLPNAKNVLIALPSDASVDALASGLALFLSLKQKGLEASIVTEGTIRVGHTNLFGVGQILSQIPQTSGGDFVITLGGVALDGKVPSVEKMDYFMEGTDLKLVFKVIPGQTFSPTAITPGYMGGNFDLIFVLGAAALENLGGVYSSKPEIFSGAHVVNINNQNSSFGNSNVTDPEASSISEMVMQILPALGLPIDGDIASNILAGVFTATSNLTTERIGADTYEIVAQALRSGGKKPSITEVSDAQRMDATTSAPVSVQPEPNIAEERSQGFDLSKVFGMDSGSSPTPSPVESVPTESFTVPPVVETAPTYEEQSSPEEAVSGEAVVTPEDDWLTPKIFGGKRPPSIG